MGGAGGGSDIQSFKYQKPFSVIKKNTHYRNKVEIHKALTTIQCSKRHIITAEIKSYAPLNKIRHSIQ